MLHKLIQATLDNSQLNYTPGSILTPTRLELTIPKEEILVEIFEKVYNELNYPEKDRVATTEETIRAINKLTKLTTLITK